MPKYCYTDRFEGSNANYNWIYHSLQQSSQRNTANDKNPTEMNKNLVLQWIPSRVGILGNEAADILAKRITFLPQSQNIPEFNIAKAFLKRTIKKKKKENKIKQKYDR